MKNMASCILVIKFHPLYVQKNLILKNILDLVKEDFDIMTLFWKTENEFKFNSSLCYKDMIKKRKRYECENAHFHTKLVRVMDHSNIVSKLQICR